MTSSAAHPQLAPRTNFRRRTANRWLSLLPVADPLVVLAALYGSVRLRRISFGPHYGVLAALTSLLCIIIFHLVGVYRHQGRAGRLQSLSVLLFSWGLVVLSLAILGDATKSTALFSRIVVGVWVGITPVLLFTLTGILSSDFVTRGRSAELRYAVVAPLTGVAYRLVQEIQRNPKLGPRILGYFDDEDAGPEVGIARLGRLSDLAPSVRRFQVDTVYVGMPRSNIEQLELLLAELQSGVAEVYLIPDLFAFDLLHASFSNIHGVPLLAVGDHAIDEVGGALKRLMDVMISAAGLVLLSPLLLAIALAIRWDSPGPAIYRQPRYGLAGERIEVLKFRTMTIMEDEREFIQARRNDPRVTRIGALLRKTSLDELPQLLNVFRGSMSLVGPRPHPLALDEQFRDKIRGYSLRHTARPGMTGWAQIHGFRGQTETVFQMQKRLDYDLDYLRRWSLLLDLYILAKTIPALLKDDNAY